MKNSISHKVSSLGLIVYTGFDRPASLWVSAARARTLKQFKLKCTDTISQAQKGNRCVWYVSTHSNTHSPQAQHFALPQRWDLQPCLISTTECEHGDREGNKLSVMYAFNAQLKGMLEGSVDIKIQPEAHRKACHLHCLYIQCLFSLMWMHRWWKVTLNKAPVCDFHWKSSWQIYLFQIWFSCYGVQKIVCVLKTTNMCK